MDKIHYLPTEGTTGFWGLRLVTEEPEVGCNWVFKQTACCPEHECAKNKLWDEYFRALESCKSNSLEIVNPEVLERFDANRVKFCLDFSLWSQLKPGDIFDLPEGYEFKEETDCPKIECGPFICEYPENCHSKTTISLVKVPQPEPEESQTELFSLVYRIMDQGGRPEDRFTIKRKKQ